MKRIIVACGSGVATSSNVAYRLDQALKQAGAKNYKVEAVDIKSLQAELKTADIYVTLSPNAQNTDFKVPVFDGIKFLTNIGANEELKKIMEELDE